MYFINFFRAYSNRNDIENRNNDLNTTTAKRMEPSEESVKNILDFARSYDVLETKATGYVEMILN